MVLHMTRPTRRPRSSFLQFRTRVPTDIQRIASGRPIAVSFPAGAAGEAAVVVRGTLRGQVKFSLQTRDPATAKERTGLATAHLERLYAAIRSGPQPLSHREIVALAGLVYKGFAMGGEDNPGPASMWHDVVRDNEAAKDGADATSALMIGTGDERRRHALERRFGRMADAILVTQGIVTDAKSRWSLIQELPRALTQAATKLQRNADGDYRPDPNAERFPAWEGVTKAGASKAKSDGRLTFDGLFERWQAERTPSASTVTTWAGYVRALRKHVGHDDPGKVTKADLVAWKDALIAAGNSPKGIRDGQLAAAKALFTYAVENDWLPANPVHGIKLRVKGKAGSRMLPYTDDEVARLLTLADKATKADRHWLPWLAALSGARIGEVGQLWGSSIVRVDGIDAMQIAAAADGGSLKNEVSERLVPIHPALIERGFLEFARSRGSGPLFYGRRQAHKGTGLSRKAATGDKNATNAALTDRSSGRRHASKGVANHLASWIRDNGFTDPRKAPNHALRHWFKNACRRAGVLDSVADDIQGHSGQRGEADRYRHADLAVMYDAIQRIPVPRVAGGPTSGPQDVLEAP
jgi:integrase